MAAPFRTLDLTGADSARLKERIAELSTPEPNTGCWLWERSLSSSGYGQIKFRGKVWPAHRVAYAAHRGDVPVDLMIDHLCRVRSCVNPDHMELVTARVNLLRGSHRLARVYREGRCLRGHPYTPENTIWKHEDSRQCRTCFRASQAAERSRKRDSLRARYREWYAANRERLQAQYAERREAVCARRRARHKWSEARLNLKANRCRRGHEFTPENTYTFASGARTCVICKRETAAKRRSA